MGFVTQPHTNCSQVNNSIPSATTMATKQKMTSDKNEHHAQWSKFWVKATAKEQKKRRKPLTVKELKERKHAKQTKQSRKSHEAHCLQKNEDCFTCGFFKREERIDVLLHEEMQKFARDCMEHSEWVQSCGTSILQRFHPAHFPGDDC